MANPRFAWGIDIGNRALKAVKLAFQNDALRVTDVDVIEHEQVLSNSGDNRESLIQGALANFAQRHQVKGGVVAIGVSGQASFARFIKLPPVEEKKIPEIVRFEAIQQIPFPLDDVEWSYQLFRQTDSPDVEVGIFAMRKELVNQQIKYFSDMDMNVQVVQMNPLAVYNAMYYDSRLQDGTTMILDLGAENADLIIADGESVWLRSISIGGNNFTEALVKAFKLSFAKAEDLKRNAQTSKYARQIFQAMRPIFADLVAEIQRSIGFYSSVHRDSRIKKILALGNTFRLPTLQKYLQQNLQIEVERLDGFVAGAPDDGRLVSLLNENIASMAGAYGLALQAMGQGKISSSLLPTEIRRAKVWKEKTKWFALAASLCVLAAGVKFGAAYYHRQQFDSHGDERRAIDKVLADAKKLDGEWGQIENSGGSAKQVIRNVRSLLQYRDFWADLWLDISSVLPPDTSAPAAKLKATPRNKRQQIFVDAAYSQYVADMSKIRTMSPEEFKQVTPPGPGASAVAASVGGGGAPRASDDEGGGAGPAVGGAGGEGIDRGYLITLHCTSPNADAPSLVQEALVNKLLSELSPDNAAKAKKPYCVVKAMILSTTTIDKDETRKSALRQAYDTKRNAQSKVTDLLKGAAGAEGAGGGGGARKAPPAAGVGVRPAAGAGGEEKVDKDDKTPFLDPLFPEESCLGDTELVVLLAVVLDPKPAAPKPEEAAPVQTDASPANDDRRAAVVAP